MTVAAYAVQHWALVLAGVAVAWALGRWMSRSLDLGDACEEIAFSTALGLGTLGTLFFALGVAGAFNAVTVGLVLGVAAALSWTVWPPLVGRLRSGLKGGWASGRRLASLGIAAAFLALAGWLAVQPLYPPHLFDAVSYHLPVAKEFIRSGSVEPAPLLRFCVFPQLQEILFAAALLAFNDLAAQSLQFVALVMTALGLIGFGRRYGVGAAGLLAGALTVGVPGLLIHASAAYIDVGLMMFGVLGVLAFCHWVSARDWRWLALSGALIGFAAASKYTAAIIALTLVAALLWLTRRARFRGLLPFLLALAVTAGPWYARNWAYTGNPVFPFASSIFGNDGRCWSERDLAAVQKELQSHGGDRGLIPLVRLPWALTFEGKKFLVTAPFVTPLYLAAIPFIPLALRRAGARGWILFAVAFTFLLVWFASAQLVRYLYLVIPLLAALTAEGLWRLVDRFTGRAVANAVMVVAAAAVLVSPVLHLKQARKGMGPVPTTARERDRFLSRFGAYPCIQWLNQKEGDDYRVYVIPGEPLTYFFDGTRMGDVIGPASYSTLGTESAEALYHSLKRLDADYFMVASSYLFGRVRKEPFFKDHFTLQCGSTDTLLWKVDADEDAGTPGPELVRDPRFSRRSADGSLTAWMVSGTAPDALVPRDGGPGVLIAGDAQVAQWLAVRPGTLLEIAVDAVPALGDRSEAVLTYQWQTPEGPIVDYQLLQYIGAFPDGRYESAFTVPRDATRVLISLKSTIPTIVRGVSIRPLLRSRDEVRAVFSQVSGNRLDVEPNIPHRRLEITPFDDGARFDILEPGAIVELPVPPSASPAGGRVRLELDLRGEVEPGPWAFRFFAGGGPSEPVWIAPAEHADDPARDWTRFTILVPPEFATGLSKVRIDPPAQAGGGWFEVRKIRLRPGTGGTP